MLHKQNILMLYIFQVLGYSKFNFIHLTIFVKLSKKCPHMTYIIHTLILLYWNKHNIYALILYKSCYYNHVLLDTFNAKHFYFESAI